MTTIKTLIVEDSETFRHQLRRFLDSQEEITVIGEAVDGYEAIEKANRLKPDLILMDIRMPKMNGLHAINNLNGLQNTKVIILTAFDFPEYREAAREIGASDYVVKRSMLDTLMPAIRGICKST